MRLNSPRSDDLFDDIVEVSRTAANIKIRTQSETFKRMVFSQSSMYVLLGTVVFVVPTFSDTLAGASIAKTYDGPAVRRRRVFRPGADRFRS